MLLLEFVCVCDEFVVLILVILLLTELVLVWELLELSERIAFKLSARLVLLCSKDEDDGSDTPELFERSRLLLPLSVAKAP